MESTPFTPEWLESHRVDISSLEPGELIGVGHVRAELRSLLGRLHDPERTALIGAEMPRGILLHGAPGTGKTLFGRVLARQLGGDVPFYEVSADELSPDRVRGALHHLSQHHPRSILFMDEIQLFANRDPEQGSPETRALLGAALSSLSGLTSTAGPIVVAATTADPSEIVPALLRAGRLGIRIRFDLPDTEEREALLRRFAQGKVIAPPIDWTRAAEASAFFAPADLRQAIDDALGLALADGRHAMADRDLRAAIHRDGTVEPEITADTSRRASVHEAGHVAAAAFLLGPEMVRRVTVGSTTSTTLVGDEDDRRTNLGREALMHRLTIAYAGGAAEEIVLGGGSLGTLVDREKATSLLLDMAAAGLIDMAPALSRSSFGMFPPAILDVAILDAIAPVSARAVEAARRIVATAPAAIERFADLLLAAGGELAGEELAAAIEAAGFCAADSEGRHR